MTPHNAERRARARHRRRSRLRCAVARGSVTSIGETVEQRTRARALSTGLSGVGGRGKAFAEAVFLPTGAKTPHASPARSLLQPGAGGCFDDLPDRRLRLPVRSTAPASLPCEQGGDARCPRRPFTDPEARARRGAVAAGHDPHPPRRLRDPGPAATTLAGLAHRPDSADALETHAFSPARRLKEALMRAFPESRLRGLVAETLGVSPEELSSEVSLADDLAADSLDIAELVVRLEGELGV